MKYGWIEEYQGCSCCTVELRRKDLLGYCKFHGGDHKNRMKIPYEKGDPLGNSSDPRTDTDESF